MKHRPILLPVLMVATVAVAGAAGPQEQTGAKGTTGRMDPGATAELKNREGQTIGRARLTETPNGVLLMVDLDRAPAGEHAFHIHAIGKCEAPSFESAGGHFNPTNSPHGFLDAKGPHAGDLPNIHVPSSGQLSFEHLVDDVTIKPGANSLFDQDGSALVVHAKPDDYRTDPAGAAGDRLACGVIQKQ